jgi:N6-adenosine-specific RNA methylase IME4
MTLAEIKMLPLGDLAAPYCRLFLWATNRYLPDAFDVIEAWGFTYRQTLVWHKTDAAPFPAAIAVPTAEFFLVANRGKPPRTGTLPSAVIRDGVPKRGGHSAKPDCFLDYVEQTSPGPYLELFARRQRLGWDTWGNEALNHVEISA